MVSVQFVVALLLLVDVVQDVVLPEKLIDLWLSSSIGAISLLTKPPAPLVS